jgi:hypothetical protein
MRFQVKAFSTNNLNFAPDFVSEVYLTNQQVMQLRHGSGAGLTALFHTLADANGGELAQRFWVFGESTCEMRPDLAKDGQELVALAHGYGCDHCGGDSDHDLQDGCDADMPHGVYMLRFETLADVV